MGDYVVVSAGVGIFHDPEEKTNRKWQDHRKGEVLTAEDLKYTDVNRLLELKAIRPVADEADEDEEDDNAPYEAWTVPQLKEEIGRRNDAKAEGEDLLPTTGVKADLVAVLEDDDEERKQAGAGASAVPEAAGATIPESH